MRVSNKKKDKDNTQEEEQGERYFSPQFIEVKKEKNKVMKQKNQNGWMHKLKKKR